MTIDGRTATKNAKTYFEETHGTYMVWEFQVEKLEYDETNKLWILGCSFITKPGSVIRLRYEVRISDEGNILGTKKIEV